MVGISVIIPTYNRASFLDRALNSVQQQTLSCDEIIVVDDGSIDNTRDSVAIFSRQCEIPVRYIYQDNQGPAAARNRGIKESGFSFIAFLDSDDHWQKNKLELQYKKLLTKPDVMISHTREKWFRRGVHLNQKKIHQPGKGDIFEHCLKICAVGMSTVMVRKELFQEIGLFNKELRCCEDYDLWLRVSSRFPFLLVDEPLTIKEGGREDQVSYQFRVGMDRLRIRAIVDLIKEQSLSTEQTKWALEELYRKCMVYGNGCLKHKRAAEGKEYTRLAEWVESQLSCDLVFPVSVPEYLDCNKKNLSKIL
ncbi:MAG TPA: glycosyltransferase family 2 protein [Desulfobacterales bacterium]|nr:glycosyltransferase family 2 protein [Desulfobacterales bacterium]HIP37896.1 glycosyltransferase family 2 protein [Desulfocapsa sulfexigens]